jgi:alanine-glyoxylate transaminase/serine-glyoxylate transaminase/serine-pyruvate transaminase
MSIQPATSETSASSERTLLMIPGPIELDPEVLRALSRPQLGHMDPAVTRAFGRVLTRAREVFLAPAGQPFVIAGSGTLAMELAVANIVDAEERAVVVNTGYFGDRMRAILERLGVRVEEVRAPLGEVPDLAAVERALAAEPTKLLTVTHVDTSSGVRAPVEALARLARDHGALVVVDGVCAVGGEELRQEAWGIDVCLTASQKALGAPPGLAVLVASPRALAARRAKKVPVASLYLDLLEWLPIMEAYESGTPKYFATPPVNLIFALDVSLGQLLAEGVEARVARHDRQAAAFRAGCRALGLQMLPARDAIAASTLSAVYYPAGIDASLVARVRAEGIAIAGGLHPEARAKYFRVGHMGAMHASDLLAVVGGLERALVGGGHKVDLGSGLAACQATLLARAPLAPMPTG